MSSVRSLLYQALIRQKHESWAAFVKMRSYQWHSLSQVESYQKELLAKTLIYAYEFVPYYRDLLRNANIIIDNKVSIENFCRLPILKKEGIRQNYSRLTTRDRRIRHIQENSTGGSSGQPLRFLQETHGVRICGGAVLRLFYDWHDLKPGDREIKVWGSERDLFSTSEPISRTIKTWLSGVRLINAFRMTPQMMGDYIKIINQYRPKIIRGYSSALYEMARHIEKTKTMVNAPMLVISSAGTLFDEMRGTIERAFGAKVFNHYGSREMHNMAMECPARRGLHVSSLTHYIEILDEENEPCPPEKEGRIVVTPFFNRAMPLIRYDIGDRGAWGEGCCDCGRGFPLLTRLSGRQVESFRTRDGRIIPGEFFIHVLGVMNKGAALEKFQVIQRDYEDVLIKIVVHPGQVMEKKHEDDIREKCRVVLGGACNVSFEYVPEIETLPSGKYAFTICRL